MQYAVKQKNRHRDFITKFSIHYHTKKAYNLF